MTKITHYDFSDLRFSSFFINGFIENERERGYKFDISRQLAPEFEDIDPNSSWLNNVIPFSLYRVEGNDPFLFCIDADDKNGGDQEIAEFYQPFLDRCKYFFRVNYNADAIAKNPTFKPFTSKIKPVANGFPLAPSQPWRLVPKLTPLGAKPWPRKAIRRRLSYLRRSISLDRYRQLRNRERDVDVFFIITLYNLTQSAEQVARRRAVVDGLNKRPEFNIIASYICEDKTLAEGCGPYEAEFMNQKDYIDYSARSRLGIYLRGWAECQSFKFGELMALGKPLVGETLINNTETMYAYDYFDEQFAFDDPDELVDRVFDRLQKPEYLKELRRANTETFEKYLTPKPVVKDILDQIGVG